MDYASFLNHEIVNKNNEVGVVISFNKERITVRFKDRESSFNPQVAFTNKFLFFKEQKLNELVENEFITKEEEKAKVHEAVQKKALNVYKKVNSRFQRLKYKVRVLKALFGDDFIYPPYEELKEQYHLIIEEDSWFTIPYHAYYKKYIEY